MPPSPSPPRAASERSRPAPGLWLPARLRAHTTDPDEAEALWRRAYPGAKLEALPGRPFDCDLQVTAVGPFALITSAWGGAARTRGDAGDRYVLAMPARGGTEIVHGRERLQVIAGERGAVLSPSVDVSMSISAASEGQSLAVDRAAVEAQFATLTGRAVREPIVFTLDLRLDPTRGPLPEIAALLRRACAVEGGSPLLLAALGDALLTALLVTQPHSARALLDGPPPRIAPASVRRAEAYIEAHAVEALSLPQIAAAAGVPARSLQAAFRSARAMTPMEFLRARRLEIARARLLGPEPGDKVARIAAALGFTNRGRFAVEYQKRFGESPAETLARGRVALG